MAEYRLKYYAVKASIKKLSSTIKEVLKIEMMNNLESLFKTNMMVVNDQIRKHEKWKEDNVLFKANEEEETYIKADHRASANFGSRKSNGKLQEGAAKVKNEFVHWPKYRKCACK